MKCVWRRDWGWLASDEKRFMNGRAFTRRRRHVGLLSNGFLPKLLSRYLKYKELSERFIWFNRQDCVGNGCQSRYWWVYRSSVGVRGAHVIVSVAKLMPAVADSIIADGYKASAFCLSCGRYGANCCYLCAYQKWFGQIDILVNMPRRTLIMGISWTRIWRLLTRPSKSIFAVIFYVDSGWRQMMLREQGGGFWIPRRSMV